MYMFCKRYRFSLHLLKKMQKLLQLFHFLLISLLLHVVSYPCFMYYLVSYPCFMYYLVSYPCFMYYLVSYPCFMHCHYIHNVIPGILSLFHALSLYTQCTTWYLILVSCIVIILTMYYLVFYPCFMHCHYTHNVLPGILSLFHALSLYTQCNTWYFILVSCIVIIHTMYYLVSYPCFMHCHYIHNVIPGILSLFHALSLYTQCTTWYLILVSCIVIILSMY